MRRSPTTPPLIAPSRRRRWADLLRVPLALLLALGLALSTASAATATADEVASRLNGARQASGLSALSRSSDLDAVAQTWAQTMAADGRLRHNPNLSSAVGGWSAIAENVGTGGSAAVVHEALMASSGHRANILGPYSQVGVGMAAGGGSVWVVQVFRTPSGAPAPAPPPPAPAPPPPAPAPAPPAPAPAPVVRPAPPAPVRPPAPARPAAAEASRSGVPAAAPVAAPVPAAPVGPAAVPVAATPSATATALQVSAAMRAIGGRGPWRIIHPFAL